jgi:hypothetical protein
VACARFLLWTGLAPDGPANAVSCLVQQATGQVIPLLAEARDESALKAILSERLSPLNYQRRSTTNELSEGAVRIAMDTLGAFANRVMTLEEASALPTTVTVQRRPLAPPPPPPPTVTDSKCEDKVVPAAAGAGAHDTLAAFGSMLPISAVKKRAPFTFASRCDAEDGAITSVEDLLARIASGAVHKLEVKPVGLSITYAASTTLEPDKLSVPHLWAFYTGRSPAECGMTAEFVEVAAVMPLHRYVREYKNVLFLVEGARPPPNPGNCCFPAFLSVQHRRTCGKAFERINTALPIVIPEGPVACGVGTSASGEDGKLVYPVHIRVNGKTSVVIERLGEVAP